MACIYVDFAHSRDCGSLPTWWRCWGRSPIGLCALPFWDDSLHKGFTILQYNVIAFALESWMLLARVPSTLVGLSIHEGLQFHWVLSVRTYSAYCALFQSIYSRFDWLSMSRPGKQIDFITLALENGTPAAQNLIVQFLPIEALQQSKMYLRSNLPINVFLPWIEGLFSKDE